MWRHVANELKVSARALLKTPRFLAVTLVTLALGIGANSTIFSVVNSVLLRPLELNDSDRLAMVSSTAPGLGYDQFPLSPDVYFFYRNEASAFEDIAMFQGLQANLTGDGEPERVGAALATASLWSVLRESAVLGRVWTAEDDLPEAGDVVVLSYELWQRRFGGSRDVLGRTVEVNGRVREIIGVMREGLRFPEESQLWIPVNMDPENPQSGNFAWPAVARLADGVTPAQAQAQLEPMIPRILEAQAEAPNYVAFLENGRYGPLVSSLREIVVGNVTTPLWILLGTVGVVLLIACANVANLFLVRAETRQREFAVRSALGASRWDLIRQYLSESAILAATGGGIALFLTWVGIPLLLRAAPPQIPRADEITVDWRVVAFTGAATLLAAVLFTLAPVLRYTGASILGALRQGGRGGTAGKDRHRLRSLLVVGQTGMALILLVGSGLLVRSFWELRNTDPGFVAEDVLTFRLSLPESTYDSPESVLLFHEQLEERLAAIPGVQSVGLSTGVPMAGGVPGTSYKVEDRPTEEGQLPPMLHFLNTGPGYLETMGIPLLAGRTLEAADHRERRRVMVISSVIADQLWPGEDAIGRRLTFAGDTTGNWYEVVGVVGAVRYNGLREDAPPVLYHAMVSPDVDPDGRQWLVRDATWVIRGVNVPELSDDVRQAVWDLDSGLPVAETRTMEEIVSNSMVQLSFTMLTLGIAAFMALILGAVGLYGVLSYVVSQRRKEIGVRMALGAEREQVMWMVVGQGTRLAGGGLVVGLLGAAGLTRLLQTLLYDTPAMDPMTFGGTAVILLFVGAAASYVPARKAAAVDPMEAMRLE
jgi:predicted permease